MQLQEIGKPFTQKLVLIWGPGKAKDERSGPELKALHKVRARLKNTLRASLGDRYWVAWSEDDDLLELTRKSVASEAERLLLSTGGEIAVAESLHLRWASLVVCLDYPKEYMTIHAEYGLVYDFGRDVLEHDLRIPEMGMWVFIPAEYVRQYYARSGEKAVPEISTSGSVGHYLLTKLYNRLLDLNLHVWITPEQYAVGQWNRLHDTAAERVTTAVQAFEERT